MMAFYLSYAVREAQGAGTATQRWRCLLCKPGNLTLAPATHIKVGKGHIPTHYHAHVHTCAHTQIIIIVTNRKYKPNLFQMIILFLLFKNRFRGNFFATQEPRMWEAIIEEPLRIVLCVLYIWNVFFQLKKFAYYGFCISLLFFFSLF